MAFCVADAKTDSGEDKGLVLVDREGNIEHTSRAMVVACVTADNVEHDEALQLEAVAAGNFSMERIADYYRQVFIRSPEYFQKFWARFQSHNFA
jgi:hypothetical protein